MPNEQKPNAEAHELNAAQPDEVSAVATDELSDETLDEVSGGGVVIAERSPAAQNRLVGDPNTIGDPNIIGDPNTKLSPH